MLRISVMPISGTQFPVLPAWYAALTLAIIPVRRTASSLLSLILNIDGALDCHRERLDDIV